MMNILIVDDHALFREGLKSLLVRLDDHVGIHEAGSIEAGLALGQQHHDFDLILLDLNLPGLNGLDGLKLFRQRCPASPLVILSGVDDEAIVTTALKQGAQGFIAKAASADAILADLRRVLAGEPCRPGLHPADCGAQGATETLANSAIHMTPRQIDVLIRLCRGASNKEIARDLSMSDNTVRTHLAVIFKELGARSRTEVAFLARQKGLL
jgi:DNA-binding NarL/FixJ family response regulator